MKTTYVLLLCFIPSIVFCQVELSNETGSTTTSIKIEQLITTTSIQPNGTNEKQMNNTELIKKFYTSFSEGNSAGMTACYHEDIQFTDPAFGELKGERANKMWEMLLSNKDASPEISFDNIQVTENSGTANWVAKYNFGKKKRKVVNEISAEFEFKDGKIIKHTDRFNVWKWSKQALGAPGHLIGWTPFMKRKIQKTTNKQLDSFMKK